MSKHNLRKTLIASCGCLALLILASGETTGQPSVAGSPVATPDNLICINSVGFPTTAQKIATIVGECQEFEVQAVPSAKLVLRGKVELHPSAENLATADFSELQQPGRYRLFVAGIGNSPEFTIADDVFNRTFARAMRAMYLWRCGMAVSVKDGEHVFGHEACHLRDGSLLHIEGHDAEHRDGTGGWHDAGDYNKYVGNGAFTAGMMLHAWLLHPNRLEPLALEIPNSNPAIPDYLEEIKWELDWLLKMQIDDGRVYHKLSTEKFGGFLLPEAEDTPRYYCPWGSAATADLAAIAALASRAFRPYDAQYADRCLAASRLSYTYLHANPEEHRPDQSAFRTGGYGSSDTDDRAWAAAELWEATGDAEYLQDFEQLIQVAPRRRFRSSGLVDYDWDWSNVRNLGTFTYLLSKREGRDASLLEQSRGELINSADALVQGAHEHPFGRALGERYYWGCNGTVVRQALNLQVASQLTGDSKYREATIHSLAYLLGRNPFGRSQVTGVGHLPPLHPHDRLSGSDDIAPPCPGYLVGGPWPRATNWNDDQEDYRTNEIAVNWNGALIAALAQFVEPSTFSEELSSITED